MTTTASSTRTVDPASANPLSDEERQWFQQLKQLRSRTEQQRQELIELRARAALDHRNTTFCTLDPSDDVEQEPSDRTRAIAYFPAGSNAPELRSHSMGRANSVLVSRRLFGTRREQVMAAQLLGRARRACNSPSVPRTSS